MMKQYAGLDVSQRETAVCVVGEMGQDCRSIVAGGQTGSP
jgi:hypothetical protein